MRLSHDQSPLKFKNSFYLITLAILSFCTFTSGSSPLYMISDLDTYTYDYFYNQAVEKWYVFGSGGYADGCQNQGQLATTRNPTVTSAGLGRGYDSLATHNSLYITMKLSLIDGWSVLDQTNVKIFGDNNYEEDYFLGYLTIPCDGSISWGCFPGSRGDIMDMTLTILSQHQGSSLGIQVIANPDVNGMIGSVAIRNVQILLSNQTLTGNSFCINSPYTNLFDGADCACAVGLYKASDNTCQSCNPSCNTCSGSSPSQCLSCKPGYTYSGTSCIQCDSTCQTCSSTSPTQCLTCPEGVSLSWDNTCQSTCPAPLTSQLVQGHLYCICPNNGFYYSRNNTCLDTCSDPGFTPSSGFAINYCDFTCPVGSYYFANGACKTPCDQYYLPIGTDYKYCDFPCAANEHLFEDGQCLPSCNSPLMPFTVNNDNHCKRPCATPDLFYYPYEQTCLSSCPSPYVFNSTDLSRRCNLPCPPGQYLFEDGQCIPSCGSPLIPSTTGNIKFCNRPCTMPNIFYFPDEQSCRSSCPQPYTYNTTDLSMSCTLVLSSSQAQQVATVSSVTNVANTASQGLVTASVALSADPGGASSGMLSKALQYTKYLNITYSARLELLFKSKNLTSGFIPFLPPISDSLKQDFPLYELPLRFEKFHVYSSFFVSFWEGMLSLGIVIALWILMRILEGLAFRLKTRCFPYLLVKSLRSAVQNFFITQFYCVYGDIILYSILDMSTIDFDGFAAIGSFAISIVILLIGVVILGVHIYVVTKYQRLKSQTSKKSIQINRRNPNRPSKILANFIKDYEGMGIFYLNFKDSSLMQQAFFIFLNIRNILFYLTVGLLYNHPLLQAVLLVLFSVLTILYLLIKRPFKDIINMIQQTCAEFMLFIVDICVLSLAVFDYQESSNIENVDKVSQVIVWISIALTFVAPAFIAAKGIQAAYLYFKYRKVPKKSIQYDNKAAPAKKSHLVIKQLDGAKALSHVPRSQVNRGKVNMTKLRVTTNFPNKLPSVTVDNQNSFYSNDNSVIGLWTPQLDISINQEEINQAKNEPNSSHKIHQDSSRIRRRIHKREIGSNSRVAKIDLSLIEIPFQYQGPDPSAVSITPLESKSSSLEKDSTLSVQKDYLTIDALSTQSKSSKMLRKSNDYMESKPSELINCYYNK